MPDSPDSGLTPRQWTIYVCRHGHAFKCGSVHCQTTDAFSPIEVVAAGEQFTAEDRDKLYGAFNLAEMGDARAAARALAPLVDRSREQGSHLQPSPSRERRGDGDTPERTIS